MNPFVYLTDWAKCVATTFALTVTPPLQPYENFTREPNIIQDIPLYEKAILFDEDLLKNHITSENVFVYETPINLGDQAIWNGVHVAYRAIRYGQTQDPNDLLQLKRFIVSLEYLQTNPDTGETMLLRGRCPLAEYNGSHGGYRQIHQNDTMIWQEDTSGDQFAGQVYGMAMAWRYGDQEVKDFIGILARDLYLTLKKNGYETMNSDGTRTKFSPTIGKVGSAPMGVTSYLVLAKILELQYPNDVEVRGEYRKLAIKWNQIHVASHNMIFFLHQMKYSGINQAKMATHAMLELESADRYKKKYLKGLRRGWPSLKEDGDTYLTYILYHFHPKSVKTRHLDKAMQVLQEFSTAHKLNHGVDLTNDETIRKVQWDGPRAVQPYPVWQRPASDYIWQRDPHKIKGGGCGETCTKYSGLDFLIAYYIGRGYGILSEGQ